MKHRLIAKRHWKNGETAMGSSDVKGKAYDDIIDLSLGDPDLVTDQIIVDKTFEDVKLGHTKYTDYRGDTELRSEISRFYLEEHGMNIRDEEIMVTSSGCMAMYLALEAIIDDGDEVIIHTPCFTPYPTQIELARGIAVILDTIEEEKFQINIQRLEEKITERTRAIVINTPSNPTGACFTIETLNAIAEIANKYDLVVIADEIYTLLCYESKFVPFASIDGMFERTITINSFSKDFIMTGWRIGHIVAPRYFIETIRKININVAFTSSSVSQRAALHALRNRKEIQPKLFNIYKNRVFYAASRVEKIPNMSVLRPQGSFYMYINIKKTGLSSAQVADKILHEAHVLVLPGDTFGACGEGYIRIACICGEERLGEAFDRISKMDIFK